MSVERPVGSDAPAVSVVVPSVPSYDHGPTLACLREQTFGEPYEVLLVNDASLDRCEARNRGLEAADADVVALTDDDTRPPPDWLAVVTDTFRADPDLVCLEGPIVGGCRSFSARRYVGCNLAVRRKSALGVGGFRSAYADWAEDIEFGWRMESEADGHCQYSEDLRMCHPGVPRTSMDPDCERRLRAEYPDRYDEIIAGGPLTGLYRRARLLGLTQPIQAVRNRVRRRLGRVCTHDWDHP